MPKSHRPHSQHPNAHTEQEIKWIKDYHRRNPNISICELYGKLREEKAYSRHPGSLYRVFVRFGFRQKAESTKKKSKHTGKYDTPTELGIPIHRHRRSIQTAIYLCLSGAFELFDDRFHQAFHYLLRLCSKGDPDRLRVRIHTYGKDEACTSF